jgi:hypothetical protein
MASSRSLLPVRLTSKLEGARGKQDETTRVASRLYDLSSPKSGGLDLEPATFHGRPEESAYSQLPVHDRYPKAQIYRI